MTLSYVLPIRSEREADAELTEYLRWLAERVELIIVDGSQPRVFAAHHDRWAKFARHVPPDPRLRFANGKVVGVHTGMQLATNERVIIADDDVRYSGEAIARIASLLDRFDLVRPQNFFAPSPWHARWDTARTLMNRIFSRDWPGTFGLRASTFRGMGGYDGDVLFENLELVRTVRRAGGIEDAPLDLYVRRLPPSADRFWSQRVRQAYDEFARPALLALWLLILPALIVAAVEAPIAIAGATVVIMVLAECGRRRAGGRRFFPATASLLAPVWVLERGVTSWIAVAFRVIRGGVPYSGRVIARAAGPRRTVPKA